MGAGDEISVAFQRIQLEDEGERQRLRYQAALKVLREIPSGTPDSDLTEEQRRAWKDHDEAIAWITA